MISNNKSKISSVSRRMKNIEKSVEPTRVAN